MSTSKKLFGKSGFYLDLIDAIIPIALNHQYFFVLDEWWAVWKRTEAATVEKINFILAMELIDKAHLAAVTSLMRAKRWADAACLMHDNANFVGWAASVRGLLESAGDTLDGLLNIPQPLAEHHRIIRRCLAGEEKDNLVGYKDLERELDHFVLAGWMRTKRGEDNPLKAKDNADYVRALERGVPGVLKLYHHLCTVCHPSNESINFFYDSNVGHERTSSGLAAFSPAAGTRCGGGLGIEVLGRCKLAPANDAKAIAAICAEYPAGKAIKIGAEIERHLKS